MNGEPSDFRACLVLPTFNNAGTLGDILERSLRLGLPVYVINDGSTDGTARVLEGFRAAAGVRVLCHDQNQGKAAAMRTGFAAAASDGCTHAVTIDTDGQLDPEQVPLLLEAAVREPAALVLGVRERLIEHCPRRSRVGRWLANALIRAECGLRVSDSQCGLRVYPLRLIGRINVRSGRFGYETEVITQAVWAGVAVVQVPVECRYFERRVSHFRPWVDTWRAVLMHLRLLAVRARGRGPVRQEVAKAPVASAAE